jgi:hypothetical protein
MSVIYVQGGGATVPDATETVSGKIRIATNAEATTGTNDTTAMTPAKTKTVVDAAVVGGVQYQGTFDASSPADLSNAEKGDLYVISGAGTYQGQVWAVGDHLLINEDMGGTVSPSKIDQVDNTDAVTSVAGKTGAVALVPADVTGLATVASTGSYSDLSGTPTLAAVATTGAYSDLSGTPSLATVATTGAYSDLTGTPTLGTAAAEDVGTLAGNVVQLDGTAKLPAVDGSQLTNLPAAPVTSVAGKTGVVTLVAGDVSGLAAVATSGAYSDLSGTPTLATVATTGAYSDLSGTPTLGTAAAEDVGTLAGDVVQLDGSARLPAVDGSQLTNLPAAPVTSVAGKTGVVTLVAGDVGGLATVATTGAYSDLSGTPTLGTAAAEDVGTAASNVVQLDGSARLPAVDGSQLLNLPSGATTLGALTDVDVTGVANTNVIKYNSTSGDWEDGAVAYSEVTGTPALATVATTGAYSDLSGTPALATVATTGAYSDLSGTPTLGTAAAEDVGTAASNVVQLDGSARLPAVDGSQLLNLPSAPVTSVAGKTGAVTLSTDDLTDMDTTTAAPVPEDRFKYDGSNWVPVDPFEVVTTVTTTTALTVPEQEQLVRTSGSGITLNLPNIASNSIPAGVRYQIKVTDANSVTVAPNGSELLEGLNTSYSTSGAKEALTVLCDGSGWWFV